MPTVLSDRDIQDEFDGSFAEYRNEDWAVAWRNAYAAAAERVSKADSTAWIDPDFQRFLWDENPVSSIGPGSSVTVVGAYADRDVAANLFALRSELLQHNDFAARGKLIQTAYDDVLAKVYPRYNKRRPKARLVRLLALVFPNDMTCLMDATRTWAVHRLLVDRRGIRPLFSGV